MTIDEAFLYKIISIEPVDISAGTKAAVIGAITDILSGSLDTQEPNATGSGYFENYRDKAAPGDGLFSIAIRGIAPFQDQVSRASKDSTYPSLYKVKLDPVKIAADGTKKENATFARAIVSGAAQLEALLTRDEELRALCSVMRYGGVDNPVAAKDNALLKAAGVHPAGSKPVPFSHWFAHHINFIILGISGNDSLSQLLSDEKSKISDRVQKINAKRDSGGGGGAGGSGSRRDSGSGGGGRGASAEGAPPTAPSPPGPSETLSDFLEKHKDKTNGRPGVQAFAQEIINRSPNAGPSSRYKDYSDAIADPLRPVADAGASEWRGATIDGRIFAQGDGGLREYLAFAWAATRSQGDDGAAVATSMGIDPRKESNFPINPDWILLGTMGAISPFAFMAIYKPADIDKIPETASIRVGNLKSEIKGPYNVGFYLNIGPGEIGQFAGFSGTTAADFLKMQDSSPRDWTLTIGEKSWTASKNVEFGGRIAARDWTPAGTAAAAAGPPTPEELSGAISTRSAQVTKEGTTTGGSRTLDLQNMLIKQDGSGLANVISTTLEKRIVMTGDRWTLRVNSPSNYAILIPIKMKRAMNESTHWAVSFVRTSDTVSPQPDVAYFPTSMIEWVYEKNFHKYGPTSPRIARIDYEPSDIDIDALNSDFKSSNIKVISIDEAKRSGTASGEFDTIESAIANYISLSGPKNPVGVPLYLTSNLHGQMNSYPRRVYKVG